MDTELIFSVIIPTYNRADKIEKTIFSVVEQQDAPPFEIIVVDDGSSDDTDQLIKGLSIQNLRYEKIENGERGRARNHGVSMAKAPYITFLDSDDLFYPEHLALANEEAIKGTTVFWSPFEEIDEAGKLVKRYTASTAHVREQLVRDGNIFACHGMFIKKEIFKDVRFNEDRKLAGSEDLDLWLRLSARYDIVKLNKVSNALVHHDGRSVFNFDDVTALAQRKELMLHYLKQDAQVMKHYGSEWSWIESRAYSYVALHSALNKNNPISESWRYLKRALNARPSQIIDRRILATLKHLLLRMFK